MVPLSHTPPPLTTQPSLLDVYHAGAAPAHVPANSSVDAADRQETMRLGGQVYVVSVSGAPGDHYAVRAFRPDNGHSLELDVPKSTVCTACCHPCPCRVASRCVPTHTPCVSPLPRQVESVGALLASLAVRGGTLHATSTSLVDAYQASSPDKPLSVTTSTLSVAKPVVECTRMLQGECYLLSVAVSDDVFEVTAFHPPTARSLQTELPRSQVCARASTCGRHPCCALVHLPLLASISATRRKQPLTL